MTVQKYIQSSNLTDAEAEEFETILNNLKNLTDNYISEKEYNSFVVLYSLAITTSQLLKSINDKLLYNNDTESLNLISTNSKTVLEIIQSNISSSQ